MDYKELDRILSEQPVPFEAARRIKHIANALSKEGLYWVMVNAYSLGVIEGKRAERLRRRERESI